MATVIDDLLVRLGFDADTSGADSFDSSLKNMLGTIGKVGSAIVGAGAVIAGALGATAIKTAETVDEAQRLAQVANVTTQELQYLDVNDKTGDFLSTGAGTMKDFFENIAPQVGVTAEAFRGLSGAEGLQLYYNSLQDANLSQAEMTFYMESIANDATMLIPLLKDGGAEFTKYGDQAKRAGLVMDDAALESNRKFLDNINRAKTMWKGLNNVLTQRSIPFINEVIDWVLSHEDSLYAVVDSIAESVDWMAEFIRSNSEYIVEAFWLINDALYDLWDMIKWTNDAIYDFLDAMGLAEHRGKILAGFVALIVANLAGLAALKVISTIMMMARGFALLLSPLALIGGALIAFFLVAQDIYGYLNGQDSVIGGLIKDYPQLQYVVDAVVRLVDAIKRLWTDNQAGIMQLFAAIVGLYQAFEPLINILIAILPYAFEAMLMAATMIINAISLAIQGWVLIFTGVVAAITAIWSGLWSAISSIASTVIDSVSSKIQSIISLITGAIGKVKELASYSPSELGGKAVSWAAGKIGIGGGGGGNTSSVNQTFNVSSASEATSIAKGSTGAQRRSNTGVKQ